MQSQTKAQQNGNCHFFAPPHLLYQISCHYGAPEGDSRYAAIRPTMQPIRNAAFAANNFVAPTLVTKFQDLPFLLGPSRNSTSQGVPLSEATTKAPSTAHSAGIVPNVQRCP